MPAEIAVEHAGGIAHDVLEQHPMAAARLVQARVREHGQHPIAAARLVQAVVLVQPAEAAASEAATVGRGARRSEATVWPLDLLSACAQTI